MCAKQKGIIKLHGKVGNLAFYSKDGVDYVREISVSNKRKIKTSPAFKRNRENMMEFGGCSMAGKAFRLGLGEIIKDMGGKYISARFTGQLKKVIEQGNGIRGQRNIELLANGHVIEGFEFNPDTSLGGVFTAPYDVSVNSGRNEITVTIPVFKTHNYIASPNNASHFRIINAITVLSDYAYNNALKGYKSVNPEINSKNKISYSDYTSLDDDTTSILPIVSSIPSVIAIPATSSLMACIGIEFYQLVNGNYYLLASKNAMRLEKVL